MKYLLALLLFVPELGTAQIWMGDTAAVREGRPTRGYFYVDTTATIGWKKVDPKLPWIGRIRAPLEYQDWWMSTAQCQGLPAIVSQHRLIRYFFINSEIFGNRGPFQVGYAGYFLPDSMAIYMALPYVGKKALVTHEQTHALMWLNKETPGHPRNRYGPFGCGFSYVP